ncbi:MAG: hypothetical protein ACE5JU_10520 [Candidatus Binatia bacterium]
MTKTSGYGVSQMMRKRIEELFAEAKEFMGLRRAKFRIAVYVQEQVLLTAGWRARAFLFPIKIPGA